MIYLFIYIIMISMITFNLTKHCALGLSWYSKPKSEDLTNNKNINFFAIGDIQNNHNLLAGKPEIWDTRIRVTNQYINAINDLTNKFKSNNFDNIDLSNLTKEQKELFMDISKDEIIGLISPGDCVQYGNSDGRLHKSNSVGAYEYALNNNTEDGGLLDIPSYECLGNHDHDMDEGSIINKVLYLDGNPTTNMQNRRNNYRKHVVNKDEHGNYSCDWGKLHMIFINIWPSNEKLLTGDPTGSLEFIEKDLEEHGHKKWMIVTHYIPQNTSFASWDLDTDTQPMKDFGVIYDKYKSTSLGGLSGHDHVLDGRYTTGGHNDFKYHTLPGPAAFSREKAADVTSIEIPIFSFNQDKGTNVLFQIIAEEGKDYVVHNVY